MDVGHVVVFGKGPGSNSCFRWPVLGVRTFGFIDVNILRACSLFRGRQGRNRIQLRLPDTFGVTASKRRGAFARLTKDLRAGQLLGETSAQRAC